MIRLALKGNIPSKKNRYVYSKRGVYKPKKTTDREDSAKLQLQRQKIPKLNIETPLKITAFFMLESKRRRDLSNMRQSVEDILVKYGLLADDDCKIIADLHLKYAGVDKDECGCYIEIYGVADE